LAPSTLIDSCGWRLAISPGLGGELRRGHEAGRLVDQIARPGDRAGDGLAALDRREHLLAPRRRCGFLPLASVMMPNEVSGLGRLASSPVR
jgi:hypothetical protein